MTQTELYEFRLNKEVAASHAECKGIPELPAAVAFLKQFWVF
jgi:hypothetical protein